MPCLVVVCPDESRVLLRVGLAVEQDDRDSPVISLVDDGRDGMYLVGGDDKQVDPILDELADLLRLQPVVVIGRGELQSNVVVLVGTHDQLAVELVTPDVFRTL